MIAVATQTDTCDSEVYEKGVAVMVTHTISATDVELWVQKVAKLSNQRVDWHYMGGRAVIRALGDIKAVDEAIQKLLPEHDELYQLACLPYNLQNMQPPRFFPNREESSYGMG